jgi:hypothetical protein
MTWLFSEISDLVGSLVAPIRALVVSLAGVWLAASWLAGHPGPPLRTLVAGGCATWFLDRIGHWFLPSRPRAAVLFMECWILAPMIVAVGASAAVVLVTVHLAVPESTPVDRKTLISAATAAVTGFLTSGFVAWTGDKDASRASKRIQRAFQAAFSRPDPHQVRAPHVHYFRADSVGERLVFGDDILGLSGWNRDARWARAKALAHELSTRASDA